MSVKSTRKGKAGELEVMHILREHGYHVERGGTQSFGQQPDLHGLDHVHLEVKRAERAQIWDWMKQSEEDSKRFENGMPTVIFRRSRSNWLICMELNDWLDLYEMAHKCQCGGACSAAKTDENRSSYQAPADSNYKE